MKVFVAVSEIDGVLDDYLKLASSVATILVRHKNKLIFGGLDTGMMGKCYMTYKYEGGKVKAVVEVHDADSLDTLEVDSYDVMPTTFERTKMSYDAADLILILPGGIGTIGEFFSMIDEKRQKFSNKKIILFDYNNYYTPLLKYLEGLYKKGFIYRSDLQVFDIITDINSLDNYLTELERKEEMNNG